MDVEYIALRIKNIAMYVVKNRKGEKGMPNQGGEVSKRTRM
jgi:hypothetical protein